MIYENKPQKILKKNRAEYNKKILCSIDMGKVQIPRETIFNCYTGLGGLHNLKQGDFTNLNEYEQAKKEFEIGQFFTPHELCRQIVELAGPLPDESVLDMCCGMGNFFNYLPNLFNAYGFDVDSNAVKVAKHLYPDANIAQCDIRDYDPDQRFDLLLGNPPFNLDFKGEPSQLYYMKKAYDILNPAALMIVIGPRSFMQNEFWNKSHIKAIEWRFSFIGQTSLASNTFASLGVENFETKIMVFSRDSEHIQSKRYVADEFLTMDQLQTRITDYKESKQALKLKLRRETNNLMYAEELDFNFKLKKYLFELKVHPHLQGKYDQAVALITKFQNQKKPDGLTNTEKDEWERRKLTHAKVLAVLRRYIRHQYDIPRKEVALVRTKYSFKLKAYAPHLIDNIEYKEIPLYQLIAEGYPLPDAGKWMTPKLHLQYESARKTIRYKQRQYALQSQPFQTMSPDKQLSKYISELHFYNKKLEKCEFIPLQQHDMNVAYQKRYFLLNWQQGSGKTAVAYHFGKYLRNLNGIRNIVVVAPANAIEMTWEPFLQWQNKLHVRVTEPSDLNNIEPGIVVIVSLTMLDKLERAFKQFMKLRSNKICLIFDESDEITNDRALRTELTLNIFRRAKCKVLATGTTVRNNITELYSQLELLYNNSVNMLCMCKKIYYEDCQSHLIITSSNPNCGKPFPPRRGANLFKACFNPSKATVFGIERHNRDIYNKIQLRTIINKTIITRSFKEFAGDKYTIKSCTVKQGTGEKAVYQTILKEFTDICYYYFKSTGDAKKEAALRIIRQIKLLIKACSVPNEMIGYNGDPIPRKAYHIAKMVKLIPEKVAIGFTTLSALRMYADYFNSVFPDRQRFIVQGAIPMKRRRKILDAFEQTEDGLLLCTQQSLKSSVNIPSCKEAILEALQWNIPKMEQFFFRFIRLDSVGKVRVRFVTYEDSIEQNLYALVASKERLNEFIKFGELRNQSEIFDELDIPSTLIESLLKRGIDSEGKVFISWGKQKIAA